MAKERSKRDKSFIDRARRKTRRANYWKKKYLTEGNPDEESLAEFKVRWIEKREEAKEIRESEKEDKREFMLEINAKEFPGQEFIGQTKMDAREQAQLRARLQRAKDRKERRALEVLEGEAGRGVEQLKRLPYDDTVPGMLGGGKVYSNSTRKSQYKAG